MIKRLLFVIALICCFNILYGQQNANNVSKKYIESVLNSYANLPERIDDNGAFWEYIQSASNENNKYLNDESRLAKKVRNRFAEIIDDDVEYFAPMLQESNIEDAKFFCGKNYEKYIRGIFWDNDPIENAYALPSGFIFIAKGMSDLLMSDSNVVGMIGVIAHEITHSTLRHAEIHEYSLRKTRRKNNWIAGISAGLNAAVITTAVITAADAGIDPPKDLDKTVINSTDLICAVFDDRTRRYRYSYGREQEIEADIVACLFLKWVGSDPDYYIQVLQKLSRKQPDIEQTDESTHPELRFRVATLRKIFMADRLPKFNNKSLIPK